MIGQFIFFILFIFTFLAGIHAYLSPNKQGGVKPWTANSDVQMADEETRTNDYQQLDVKTTKGMVQIRKQMEELSNEQKQLITLINEDQQVLKKTNEEITGILKQTNGANGADVLKLKAVAQELQDNQRLLVDRGQTLIAFNDQLTKSRLWLAQQNELLRLMNQEPLEPNLFYDRIAQRNNDIIGHAQELLNEERQKTEDQQDRQTP